MELIKMGFNRDIIGQPIKVEGKMTVLVNTTVNIDGWYIPYCIHDAYVECINKHNGLTKFQLKDFLNGNLTYSYVSDTVEVAFPTKVEAKITETVKPTKAVVIFFGDCSGSMGDVQREAGRAYAFRYISEVCKRWSHVDTYYFQHTTELKKASSMTFLAKALSGGTIIGKSMEALETDFAFKIQDDTFYYFVHITDGDNLTSDNARAVNWVKKFLSRKNTNYQYVETRHKFSNGNTPPPSTFARALDRIVLDDEARYYRKIKLDDVQEAQTVEIHIEGGKK